MENESRLQRGLFLFWTFFKGMMFAFTGGMAAIPVVEKDLVERKKWLTDKEFWTFPAIGQSLPGVIGIHNSILIGNRIAGPFGAFMAALGVILPAFLSMLIVAALFQTFVDNLYVQGIIRGIRAAAVVIILGIAEKLMRSVRKDPFSLVLAAASVLVPLFFDVSVFWMIISCGLAGIISVILKPDADEQKEGK